MNSLAIDQGVHMQIYCRKIAVPFFILAAVAYATVTVSVHHTPAAVSPEERAHTVVGAPLKVENISADYSGAHAAVMKTPDEVRVNTF
jgi:hypothetical protein